ncbi:MAG: hypothetical protein KKG93_13885, partial [Bacteroidetes bacterium]|nr:hypothetical protein [Bacteroidota bacterium]
MKILNLLIILTTISYNLTAQNVIEKLKQLTNQSYIKVHRLENNIIQIKNQTTGKTIIKNISDIDSGKGRLEKTAVNKLTIDMSTFNFNDYSSMYHEWSSVPLTAYKSLKAVDANRNGKAEFYGKYLFWPEIDFAIARIYEHMNEESFLFISEIQDSLTKVFDIGDIEGDGLLDIVCPSLDHKLFFFTQKTDTSYIDSLKYIYGFWEMQMQTNDVTFYDFDGDGI